MYRTIQTSSCVLVQGELVELLADGRAVIRDGKNEYSGRPISSGKEKRAQDSSAKTFEATTF
jgi:hypothetical protein